MKTYSTIFSSLAMAVCFVIPAQAQQPAGKAAAGASAPYTSAAPFKIAVIEMETFFNPEKGITCVVRAIEDLDQGLQIIMET